MHNMDMTDDEWARHLEQSLRFHSAMVFGQKGNDPRLNSRHGSGSIITDLIHTSYPPCITVFPMCQRSLRPLLRPLVQGFSMSTARCCHLDQRSRFRS